MQVSRAYVVVADTCRIAYCVQALSFICLLDLIRVSMVTDIMDVTLTLHVLRRWYKALWPAQAVTVGIWGLVSTT
jgi:hypothetical protein